MQSFSIHLSTQLPSVGPPPSPIRGPTPIRIDMADKILSLQFRAMLNAAKIELKTRNDIIAGDGR